MTDQDVLLNKYGREFPKGTILFKDGDTQSKEMYVIHSGKVKISKKMGELETVLAVIGQGEFFGEMAILNNKPRSASAEVMEDSKLLVIDPKTFETMIKGNAEVAFRMIKKLADRLRETDRKIELLMIKDSSSRVIHVLEKLIEDIGVEKDDCIYLPITINELAPKSGVKMNHVNDVIEKLNKAKIISFSSEEIYIHDVSKLKQFLEFLILKEQFGDLD